LSKGGLHRNGMFLRLASNSDDELNLKPLFDALEKQLMHHEGVPLNLGNLLELAASEPFGVRRGLFLVLLFAFIMSRRNEIAIYEDSALLIDIGQYEIERLIKDPGRFAIQMVKIHTDRKVLLATYADVVGIEKDEVSVLGVVSGLLKKARLLTPYARRTGNMSSRDTAVREAIFKAEDPIKLLFEDLPKACGGVSELDESHPEWYKEFGLLLESSLRSITNAYSALLLDLQDEIAVSMMLHSTSPEDRRTEITLRSRPLLKHATNEKFRAFLVRATDAVMDTSSWFESLAALLAELPPKHWIDKTREKFRENLREVARFYITLEPLVFDEVTSASPIDSARGYGKRLRLSITALGHEEKARVISIHEEDQEMISEAVINFQKTFLEQVGNQNPDFKLAIVAKMLEKALEEATTINQQIQDGK